MKIRYLERIGCIVLICSVLTSLAASLEKHRPTTGYLADAYRTANDKFFYGGLPVSKTRVVLADLTDVEEMGHIEQYEDDSWVISIDYKTNVIEKQASFTLLHEMCHQYNIIHSLDQGLNQHDNEFQYCMLRLAKAGAFRTLW